MRTVNIPCADRSRSHGRENPRSSIQETSAFSIPRISFSLPLSRTFGKKKQRNVARGEPRLHACNEISIPFFQRLLRRHAASPLSPSLSLSSPSRPLSLARLPLLPPLFVPAYLAGTSERDNGAYNRVPSPMYTWFPHQRKAIC